MAPGPVPVVEGLLLLGPARHPGDLVPQDGGLLVVLLAHRSIHLPLERHAAGDGKLPGELVDEIPQALEGPRPLESEHLARSRGLDALDLPHSLAEKSQRASHVAR
jgi:hypothetical protein